MYPNIHIQIQNPKKKHLYSFNALVLLIQNNVCVFTTHTLKFKRLFKNLILKISDTQK